MKKIKRHIFLKIILIDILLVCLMSFLVPKLSGYPPFSENPNFQIQIEGLTHNQQYTIFGLFGIVLHITFINIFFKNIFKFMKKHDKKEKISVELVRKVREDVFSVNTKLYILQIVILVVLLSLLFVNVKISIVLCVKFLLIYLSFLLTSIIIYILLIKDDLNNIIRKTYLYYDDIPLKVKKSRFDQNLIANLLPFFFIITIFSCLMGYTKVCEANGESSYIYYGVLLRDIKLDNLSLDQVKEKLSSVRRKNPNDYFFIIPDNYNKNNIYFSSPKGNASDFFLLYLDNYSSKTNGRVYEYFGVEEQAYVKDVILDNGEHVYIGFKYSITSLDIVIFFTSLVFISSLGFTIIVSFWAKYTSKNIVEVSNNLTRIATNKNIKLTDPLPITSNDEIGELTLAFNKIQTLTNNYIDKIRSNQDTLMERERLASLGQLIGGIAHNLKTPIMSISGAAEGLTDLVKEYDASIDDPEVNSQDHHDIAKDMNSWISKIKTHTEYMSDVITAVKGQAVTLNNEEDITFTIGELLKRVDILMKHELKNAIVYLNISLNTDEDTVIHGDINSLVQVINNMISNSIQSYKGKPDQKIDLIVSKDGNNLIITVKDYGSGIPKKVQDKLFKEMITTKGKNGTGLGLYMSYSTIKAHFNGNITLESEPDNGCQFNIILPL